MLFLITYSLIMPYYAVFKLFYYSSGSILCKLQSLKQNFFSQKQSIFWLDPSETNCMNMLSQSFLTKENL